MNSKIVILDDSVILYQHFISDDNWETVMAFPRGGLTYLIKNDNIKFFAYIDYFYRNCLMTMDLPLYIVDEELGIDGEYSDIEELTELLNRIFPALNGDVDLTPYLKKREAAELYQPIGDYQPSGNYFDDVEYDSSGKTIDFYSQGTLVDSIDARPFIKDGMVDSVTLIELSGDTYLHIVFNTDAGKEPIDIPLGDIFDADNYYTKDETDYLLDEKLDASAYTPTDLSNYYTKQQVDELIPEVPSLDGYATEQWVKNQGYINQLKTINNISLIGEGNIQIGSGGTIDAYTREEADDRFQPKGDYVTEATVIQYITNLQEQITNIIQTVSGCCSESGETQYRWITMTGANDYICSGTTKYNKEKKQQSTDGIIWTDVSPLETRRGSTVLEVNSPDCGYAPEPQYRWKAAPVSDYMCIGTDKYYKVYYEVSYDNGATWQHVVPEQTKRGNLIEANSPDCGYTPEPQYRWYQAPASDYMCSGTSKYYKEYYQVSNDGGQTWANVSPTQTRQGSLIETQSTDCGYIAPQYRWKAAPTSDYMCSGTSKYYKVYYEVSYDGGVTWQHVVPEQTKRGDLIEAQSTDCGYTFKLKVTKLDDSTRKVECNNSSVLHITETTNCGTTDYRDWKSAEVGGCVKTIGTSAFSGCTNLTSVTLSDSVTSLSAKSFHSCSVLQSINIPTGVTNISDSAFAYCSGLTNITLSSGITKINQYTFFNCRSLNNIVIPNRVTEIGQQAFSGCWSFTRITIPSSVKKIYGGAFGSCPAVTAITLNEGLELIAQNAFGYCKNASITIPSTVQTIVGGAFGSHTKNITCLATTPPTLSETSGNIAFPGAEHIYVPAASVNAYKAAWTEYTDMIQAIP